MKHLAHYKLTRVQAATERLRAAVERLEAAAERAGGAASAVDGPIGATGAVSADIPLAAAASQAAVADGAPAPISLADWQAMQVQHEGLKADYARLEDAARSVSGRLDRTIAQVRSILEG